MDEQNKKDEIEEIFSYYGRQRDKNSQEMIVALLRELQEVSGCLTPDLKHRVLELSLIHIYSFVTDTDAENEFIRQFCEERNCEFALSEVWEKGGEGGIALAEKVLNTLETKESHFHTLYENSLSLKEKIETI